MDGTAIQANDLLTNVRYLFVYDGTAFRMLNLIANDNIRNQNAAQQSANFWTLIGRLDTGLGLGIAANAAAFLTFIANTATKVPFILPKSATDYTGNINGAFYNNANEIKFYDDVIASVNRLAKFYGNQLLVGATNRMMATTIAGDVYATDEIIDNWILDSSLQAAIVAATYSSDRATILAVSGKVGYQGQMYDNGTYTYLVIDDSATDFKVRRW